MILNMREPQEAMGKAGSCQSYGERGVWVPEGMTAAEIMVGAAALEQHFGVAPFESRSMVRAVLSAIRSIR